MGIDAEDFDELAQAPRRTTGDEGTVEERSVDELIKADQHSAAKQATRAPYGLRFSKLKKPGTP